MGAPAGSAAPSAAPRSSRGYLGPDRRKPVKAVDIRAEARRALVGAAMAAALWLVAAAVTAHSPASRSLVISLSHGVTGALLLASAALALAVWRITGTARAACAVVGLALAGVSAPVMGILSRAVNSGNIRADLVEMLAGATELALIACVAAAALLPPVAARLRPLRLAALAVAGCILAVAAVLAVDGHGDPAPLFTTAAGALRVGNLVLWAAVAAIFLDRGLRRHRRSDTVIGIAVLLPAAGAAGRLLIGPVSFQTRLLPTGLQLTAACLIAGAATVALWRLHTSNGTRLIEVSGELHHTRADLAGLESDQARRLHDARNAIFAIAGATELLVHPSLHDELAPAHLQRLITAELDRLGHLLDPAFHGTDRDFTAAELIDPLAAAYRAKGVDIDTDIAPTPIHGRRELLAGVITNLLTNARVHAPGARIWVTARPAENDDLPAAAICIVVADNGPGIPPDQRNSVLLPGVRGSHTAAPGSGLGLASAVQALSEVGGTLRLSERDGGGTVATVTIPKRTAAAVRPRVHQ